MSEFKKKEKVNMFEIIQSKSIVGVALLLLEEEIVRTNDNMREIIADISVFDNIKIDVLSLESMFDDIVLRNEVLVTNFTKKKSGGTSKEPKHYKSGFHYYIGKTQSELSKTYVHWGEEKKYVVENIVSLRKKELIIDRQIISISQNLSNIYVSFRDPDTKEYLADMNMYVGCK
jgi:hypothetical protein